MYTKVDTLDSVNQRLAAIERNTENEYVREGRLLLGGLRPKRTKIVKHTSSQGLSGTSEQMNTGSNVQVQERPGDTDPHTPKRRV